MKRYIVLLGILTAGLVLLAIEYWEYFLEFVATIVICIVAECIAILLSEFSLFAFTKVPFSKLLIEGEDNKLQAYERGWVLRVAGYIFIAVHFLMGVVIAGVYFVQFN